MKLGALAQSAPNANIEGDPETEISGLSHDSRTVENGNLFFCLSGEHADGHDFAPAAAEAGAAALVVERPLELDLPQLIVEQGELSHVIGPIAAEFHGRPSQQLQMVGITGTNGKTTTAYLVRSILEANGTPCGLIGTVKRVVGGVDEAVTHTTPMAIDMQRDLSRMVEAGDRACAAEISSHALSQGRAGGCRLAVGAFTNLTQDHLDYYPGGMAEYFEAKKRMFLGDPAEGDPICERPVVNIDDSYGAELAGELRGRDAELITVSRRGRQADLEADDVSFTVSGCEFRLKGSLVGGESLKVETRLPGEFNVENALVAAAATIALGVDPADVVAALGAADPVPGRFEPIDEGQDFSLLVDYAHTPDSLENVLGAARTLTDARVICVVGCGGDRDRTKRPLMGGIAARHSDLAIITSDNPRSEDPATIVEQVAAGARAEAAAGGVELEVDRRAAIGLAIEAAAAGDVVVVAGKGHEQGQEFEDGRKLPFDDRDVARELLGDRSASTPTGSGR